MPLSLCRVFVALLVVSSTFLAASSRGDEQVERLLKRCREHLSKIKTIEETATIKWVHMPATDERPNRENTYVIRTDDRRFYDELHQNRATPDPNPDLIQSFQRPSVPAVR
jgi:hypothetical protein